MASYNQKHSIGSYTVDKTLLQNIENYCKSSLPEVIGLNSQTLEAKQNIFSVTLYDSLGSEKYSSIGDYRFQLFRNDIIGVDIECILSTIELSVQIQLNFKEEKDKTTLSLTVTGNLGREKLNAIEQGLKDTMDANRNLNGYLHFSFLALIAFFTGFISLIFIFSTAYSKQLRNLWGLILGVCIFYFLTIYFFKNYSVFDTNKQKHLDKWFSWLFFGLIGFIVFGSLFPSFRRNIFGY